MGVLVAAVSATLLAFVLAAAPAGAEPRLSPYLDVTLSAGPDGMGDLAGLTKGAGLTAVTLAFVTSDRTKPGKCALAWGGQTAFDVLSGWGRPQVEALRRSGVDVTISVGGAAGRAPWSDCTSPGQLAAAITSVAITYGVERLDFDVEGPQSPADLTRLAEALAMVSSSHEDLAISLTLPAAPGVVVHFDPLVPQVIRRGGTLSEIRAMAMDFSSEGAACSSDFPALSIDAMQALRDKSAPLFPHLKGDAVYARLGMVAMIGRNDTSPDCLSLTQAASLAQWGRKMGLASLGYWSVGRDRPCVNEGAVPHCSGALAGRPFQNAEHQYAATFRTASRSAMLERFQPKREDARPDRTLSGP